MLFSFFLSDRQTINTVIYRHTVLHLRDQTCIGYVIANNSMAVLKDSAIRITPKGYVILLGALKAIPTKVLSG